jgi:hypothetical protein
MQFDSQIATAATAASNSPNSPVRTPMPLRFDGLGLDSAMA